MSEKTLVDHLFELIDKLNEYEVDYTLLADLQLFYTALQEQQAILIYL